MMENVLFAFAWREMLGWLGIEEEDAGPMRSEVLAHYRAPERAYHNLHHALRVLMDVKTYAHWWGVEDYGAVQLAALLHDVIYVTRSQENEALSAEFITTWGRRLGVDRSTLQHASEIILATRHQGHDGSIDMDLVVDADLGILAAPWDKYDTYRRAIRREYAWVTEADWKVGRKRVLSSFLDREAIYHLPVLQVTLEESARRNLERELSLL